MASKDLISEVDANCAGSVQKALYQVATGGTLSYQYDMSIKECALSPVPLIWGQAYRMWHTSAVHCVSTITNERNVVLKSLYVTVVN
jgi:hypothetical protein